MLNPAGRQAGGRGRRHAPERDASAFRCGAPSGASPFQVPFHPPAPLQYAAHAHAHTHLAVVVVAMGLALLDGSLRRGEARNGHSKRGAAHIIHYLRHEFDRLGVPAVLACTKWRGGPRGSKMWAAKVGWSVGREGAGTIE